MVELEAAAIVIVGVGRWVVWIPVWIVGVGRLVCFFTFFFFWLDASVDLVAEWRPKALILREMVAVMVAVWVVLGL